MVTSQSMLTVLAELRCATDAKKCHRCGCFRGTVEQLRKALPALPEEVGAQLLPLLTEGVARLVPSEYDCLGCATCWPANVLNLASEQFPDAEIEIDASCPTSPPDRVPGWPPFPGNFRVLDASGDIAICVLTSESLIARLADAKPSRVAIVGAVYTENLGLERILTNVLANANITTLLLCGADSQQRIGHLPGQSLLSLMANGLDERNRIIGAQGRRPVIKNLERELVDHFRTSVSVVDQIGEEDGARILESIAALPAASARRAPQRVHLETSRITARAPDRLMLDPAGYFVVLPDRASGAIVVEHYGNDGVRAHVFEGTCAEHLFSSVIAHGLVSRLDHAAYLGKELALAERAMATGEAYVQDRAPEPESECGSDCRCKGTNHLMKERP